VSVDGIWKVEMLGPHGWDAVSTAFLEDGRYLSASQDHYTIGRYQIDDRRIVATVANHPHRPDRAMIGAPGAQSGLIFDGEINGDQISGQAEDRQAEYSMTFRATRLADLP